MSSLCFREFLEKDEENECVSANWVKVDHFSPFAVSVVDGNTGMRPKDIFSDSKEVTEFKEIPTKLIELGDEKIEPLGVLIVCSFFIFFSSL